MATKRQGSSKYRSMRNGAKHSASDCPICSGRECRVLVSNPVDGEFVADLIPLPDGRTKLFNALPVTIRSLRSYRPISSNRPVNKPLPEGYVRGLRRCGTGDLHIPTATILAMQALQTWGASNARL